MSFADGYSEQLRRTAELKRISAPAGDADALADFACMRCARATGKLNWLRHYPDSPWAFAAPKDSASPLVAVSYSPRARRTVSEVA
jgi:hypothetical protein